LLYIYILKIFKNANRRKSKSKSKALIKLEKEAKKQDNLLLMKYAFGLCFKDKEQLKVDAVVVYAELYDIINTLSIEKQLAIILKSMSIGYQASTEAYRYMVELMNSDSVKEMEAKIEKNKGNKIFHKK